ncbi:MAG: WD40/YVTN/BNR-like repeat-containing protein, partial [Planctomycetota bacterium]
MKPTAGIACIVAGVLFCAWANHADAGAVRDITADGDTIWAVGDAGTVLLSRDAGQTWNSVEVPVGTDFQAVHIAGDTVHLLGGSTIFGHPDARGKAVILRSEDGGETFQAVSTPPAGCLYGGEFEPPAAIVFGEATPEAPSGIWRTVTDGRRWTPVESEQQGYLLGGDFRDVKLGYAVGGDHRIASIRGLSEPRIHPPQTPSRRVLRAAALSSDETCWAAGDDGLLLKSRPGSQPWQQQQIPAPTATGRLLDLETVCSTPEDTVHAGGGLTGAT